MSSGEDISCWRRTSLRRMPGRVTGDDVSGIRRCSHREDWQLGPSLTMQAVDTEASIAGQCRLPDASSQSPVRARARPRSVICPLGIEPIWKWPAQLMSCPDVNKMPCTRHPPEDLISLPHRPVGPTGYRWSPRPALLLRSASAGGEQSATSGGGTQCEHQYPPVNPDGGATSRFCCYCRGRGSQKVL